MANVAKKLTDLIGNTPLLEFSNFNASKGLKAKLIGKLEYFNPAGSVKDRIAADCSARTDTGYENIDFTIRIAPDFLCSSLYVFSRIGRILELLQDDGTGCFIT